MYAGKSNVVCVNFLPLNTAKTVTTREKNKYCVNIEKIFLLILYRLSCGVCTSVLPRYIYYHADHYIRLWSSWGWFFLSSTYGCTLWGDDDKIENLLSKHMIDGLHMVLQLHKWMWRLVAVTVASIYILAFASSCIYLLHWNSILQYRINCFLIIVAWLILDYFIMCICNDHHNSIIFGCHKSNLDVFIICTRSTSYHQSILSMLRLSIFVRMAIR